MMTRFPSNMKDRAIHLLRENRVRLALTADVQFPYLHVRGTRRYAERRILSRVPRRRKETGMQDQTSLLQWRGGSCACNGIQAHLAPAGSRTEAAVSAYRLSQKRGEPNDDIKKQCLRAFRYIQMHQVRAENSYMEANSETTRGAVRLSPIQYDVRVDYVRHTMAAMVRGLDMVPE